MKILYDYQIFTSQKYGGISRYFYELIKNNKNDEIDIAMLFSNNHYISDKNIKHINFLPSYEFKGKIKLMNMFNNIILRKKLLQKKIDVYHPTYYDTYFLNYIGDKPFVITVHDMIHEKFSELFPSRDNTSYKKKILCEKAAKIIAISESTKKDLIDIFDIKSNKIKVIYHGNSMILDKNFDLVLKEEIPKKYILFVGNRKLYKNFNKFIESISKLLIGDKDLSVICVGGGNFTDDEKNIFKKLNIENKLYQFQADDKTLAAFYQKALLFVFPSLYEGFGIPILEAFACHCPVVCSNTSSLPEIAGNGAEYFDPYDDKSIYIAVKKVLQDNSLRENLIENGLERLKYFSWEKTFLETRKVYEEVIN